MTGPTWDSCSGVEESDARPRSDSSEPWDERGGVSHAAVASNNNLNDINNMRRDPYKYKDEDELEDGDLPRLNLSHSTSYGNDHKGVVEGKSSSNFIPNENIRRKAAGPEEVKKQQACRKQLDSPLTRSNDEDADATSAVDVSARRIRRFGKGMFVTKAQKAISPPYQGVGVHRSETAEAREDTRNRASLGPRKTEHKDREDEGTLDPMEWVRRQQSDESEDTRDSKECVERENQDTNFCDNTLAAMEAICGDSSLHAFCGGIGTETTTPSTPQKAKNLNILSARSEGDSVDEHTAIEVEYVEPEDTHNSVQERPENWSPTRKNAYLAAMARKAKEDFEQSQAKEMQSPASPKPTAALTAESSARDVYNSFNPADKRKFLRLINSGMTPTESAQRVRAESEASKETGSSKKAGKLFNFWKKGKWKAKSEASGEDEKDAPTDRDATAFPSESLFPQEEKKEDDRHAMAEPRFEQRKDSTSESVSTSNDTVGETSKESPPQSQSPSQSACGEKHKDSGSDSISAQRKQPVNTADERSNNSDGSSQNPASDASNSRAAVGLAQEMGWVSPERRLPRAANIGKHGEMPKNRSTSTDSSLDGVQCATLNGKFAKSGINYYDAVRRELYDSEDETKLSNQVSVSSKGRISRGPLLGPILQSPKLKGFSKLSRGGKANCAMEKNALQEEAAERAGAETSVSSPHPSEMERPYLQEGKTEIHAVDGDDSRDFSFTQNVTEYGTANFDVPISSRISIESINASSETPSKAEEEALERIEKELLRPVRCTAGPKSTPWENKVSLASVTPDSSGTVTKSRSYKSAKLRDQILAVVSPASIAVTREDATPLSFTEVRNASTVLSNPASAQASCTSHSGVLSISESSPTPAVLSLALALAPTTPPASTKQIVEKRTQMASNLTIVEPALDDLDLDLQVYLKSTTLYSQVGQVNDSLSIVSGKSFSTADTGHYGGSVCTQASTLTQSSRKRRPGAAKTRLAKAKEAEKKTLRKKGWHESIQAAAESTNHVWKPKVGWVDYTDTSNGHITTDISTNLASSEKMHLNLSLGRSSKHHEDAPLTYPPDCFHSVRDVPFQKELEGAIFPFVSRQEQTSTSYTEVLYSAPESQIHTKSPESPLLLHKHALASYSESSLVYKQDKAPPDFAKHMHVSEQEQTPISSHQQTSTKFHEGSPELANPPLLEANAKAREQARPLTIEASYSDQRPAEAAVLLLETGDPSAAKQREKVNHLLLGTGFGALDNSFLGIPPAPKMEYPSPFGSAYTQKTQKGPMLLTLDDMSIEESVAHSVDQFVQTVGASSPQRSARKKKAASSPHRLQRFASSPTKPSGWVDSMRAATTSIGMDGQSWDPLNGWAISSSALAITALKEDSAPPLSRYEEEIIQERQAKANTYCSNGPIADYSGKVELNPPEDSAATPALPGQVNRLGCSPVESAAAEKDIGREGIDKHGAILLGTTGGFLPLDSLCITHTVNVVKEKVDDEDISWFPESRRGFSKGVTPKSSEEENTPSTQRSLLSSSKSSGRTLCPTEVELTENAPVETDNESVILNSFVSETGFSCSKANTPTGGTVVIANTRPLAVTNHGNQAQASRSLSSLLSDSSLSRAVPRLSRSKRDTSPIRAKNSRSAENSWQYTQVAPAQDYFRLVKRAEIECETPPQTPKAETLKSPIINPTETLSQGEPTRALSTVSKTPSALSRQAFSLRDAFGCPSGPDRIGGPEYEAGQVGKHPEDNYPQGTGDAFPSASGTHVPHQASASNVRLRARQWEGRTPKEGGHETEQPPRIGKYITLNAATAEWKSLLGKKVEAEGAMAAEQKGGQNDDVRDTKELQNLIEQNDSLFDFSVTDLTNDSRCRRNDYHVSKAPAQPAKHRHEGVRENPPGINNLKGRHFLDAPDEEANAPPTELSDENPPGINNLKGRHFLDVPDEEANAPPTELSDHSDGNEMNKPFLARLAGCAGPVIKKGNQHGSDALAHLAFLRTNSPNSHDGKSRFMPQYLCGRQDVILEESEEAEEAGYSTEEMEGADRYKKLSRDVKSQALQMKTVPAKGESRTDSRSVISEDFGAKTAYLEALAMKTAVSKPRRNDNRRRDRSSVASDIFSSSHKLQQKEKWRDFLERKSKTGGSPAKLCASESHAASSHAENYAAKKVEEMMAIMASRSKSTPRSWRSPNNSDKRKSQFVESQIRDHTNCQPTSDVPHRDGGLRESHMHRSDSLVAAEQLASTRVNAMMQALATNSNSRMQEGEI